MKKITLLTLVLLLLGLSFVQGQNNEPSPNVKELLQRIEAQENKHLPEPADLFTQEERKLLQEYSRKNRVLGPTKMAGPGESDIFGCRFFGGQQIVTFPLAGPYDLDVISNTTSNLFAGDFDNSGTLYALDNTSQTLGTLDPDTGTYTQIGPLTNLVGGQIVAGLAWDRTTSTMYALSLSIGSTTLYTVDLSTGTLTVIGASNARSGIWLAISNNGDAYMADLINDNLYSVDLSNNVATLIGSLGTNLNFLHKGQILTKKQTHSIWLSIVVVVKMIFLV